jgi:hypothetical protein
MNWLSGLIRNVGRFLVNSIQAFRVLASGFFANVASQIFISFSASIPPAIALGINLQDVEDSSRWDMFRRFTDAILEQMETIVGP